MRIAASGFVCEQAGSIASANALLLRELVARGIAIDFFSRRAFVDPRPAVEYDPRLRSFDVGSGWAECLLEKSPLARWGWIPGLHAGVNQLGVRPYHRRILTAMREHHAREHYSCTVWLGDYASGRLAKVPSISFIQGPPGTDARSILRHGAEIRRLGGFWCWLKWRMLAALRLSVVGRPSFRHSDHFIVGSSVSKETLHQRFGIAPDRISAMPYPIDLKLFANTAPVAPGPSLRLLWLGRIVPRKRLPLFLDACRVALDQGIDLTLTIVGQPGFVKPYDRLIESFSRRDRLEWKKSVPRRNVPDLLGQHDILIQPSEEEDFGSSVAEAQAAGLPVIIGRTNGNADYLCPRSIRLADDSVGALVRAIEEMACRKREGRWGDASLSRDAARRHFDVRAVADRLLAIIAGCCAPQRR